MSTLAGAMVDALVEDLGKAVKAAKRAEKRERPETEFSDIYRNRAEAKRQRRASRNLGRES